MSLILSLPGCVESLRKHFEYKTIDGKDYQCVCEQSEQSEQKEPVCTEDNYCTYSKTYECKCREAVKYNSKESY